MAHRIESEIVSDLLWAFFVGGQYLDRFYCSNVWSAEIVLLIFVNLFGSFRHFNVCLISSD